MLLSKWRDSLFWCPSQCYAEADYEGKKITLYLRWRWEDPWQGYVIENTPLNRPCEEGEISPDLFLKNRLFFKEDDDLDKIKSALVFCAKEWLDNKMINQ